jgi:hypothetical protein
VTRLAALTPDQRAAMDTHADLWIERGMSTEPADRARVEDGLRRCYEYAGIPWHANVVWVGSPLVAALAGPIAASALRSDAVDDAVDDAVSDAVSGAVDGAVDDAVSYAVDGAVSDAVRGAVSGAVSGAVYGAVRGAVSGAVSGAVDDAVDDAVSDAWWKRLGGLTWSGWVAYLTYYRDHARDTAGEQTWERLDAYEDAMSASWVHPWTTHAVISDRPSTIRLEQVGPRGWGSHRLHCADGPALQWRDGWALHYWHGVRVPADLIETGWDVDRILSEPNTEIRRCAIERMGWPHFVEAAKLKMVGHECADPGNPGHTLALYDVPSRIYGEPVRLLLCDNATPERDGTRRRFGLTVPASIADPIHAAAWTFDLTADEYGAIKRAC